MDTRGHQPEGTRERERGTYFLSILAHATPPVVAIFFKGILWRRTAHAAAFWTFVNGLHAPHRC